MTTETTPSARHRAENGPDPLGAPIDSLPGLRAWNRELLTIGHVDHEAFLNRVRPALSRNREVDAAFHEHVHPHPEWGGWCYCAATEPDAVPITVCVPQDREIPDPTDELAVAVRRLENTDVVFKVELMTWLRDIYQHYETDIDYPECPNCGEGCGGHPPVRFHKDCGENAPCDCIKHALALAQRINGTAG